VSEVRRTELEAADAMFEIGPTDCPTVDSVSEVVSKGSGIEKMSSKDSKKPLDSQAEKSIESTLNDRQNDLLCINFGTTNVSNHSAKV
jgi:hypothetical protein